MPTITVWKADTTRRNDAPKARQEVLGYLNYSSALRSRFLTNINHLFGVVEAIRVRAEPTWQALAVLLAAALTDLRGQSEAFRQVDQAEAVLGSGLRRGPARLPRSSIAICCSTRRDESLFQPFFIGRVCEAVLQQGGPWDETDRIVPDALPALNDYLGHRPVAVLRTQQKIQPYAHEWVRPIPLFDPRGRRGRRPLPRAGRTGPGDPRGHRSHRCCSRPCSIPSMLDELAVDPRAYDFDHPVNKRPNYLFGQWDLGKLDNSGRYRRFVVQQVTLDAMLDRIEHRGNAALRGGAVRGGRRAGRHDAHGLGHQRQPARRPRLERHAGHAGAADRRLSRRVLRAAAGAA